MYASEHFRFKFIREKKYVHDEIRILIGNLIQVYKETVRVYNN